MTTCLTEKRECLSLLSAAPFLQVKSPSESPFGGRVWALLSAEFLILKWADNSVLAPARGKHWLVVLLDVLLESIPSKKQLQSICFNVSLFNLCLFQGMSSWWQCEATQVKDWVLFKIYKSYNRGENIRWKSEVDGCHQAVTHSISPWWGEGVSKEAPGSLGQNSFIHCTLVLAWDFTFL